MIAAIILFLSNFFSFLSTSVQWVRDKNLVTLGSKSQLSDDLQKEIQEDAHITQIRDKSFKEFDRAVGSGRMPIDIKFRD